MTVVETVSVFVLIPLAIYGVIALLTLWPKFAKSNRYRLGQDWDFEPVWWTGNPAGVSAATDLSRTADRTAANTENAAAQARTARGGASGKW